MSEILSIVMLNWNRLHYSKQTLERLIQETTVPHEFIFVDNGSVDGTREYLESMEHKTNAEKVTYVFNDKNLGVAGGRNSGLVLATGNYLLTIDDDVLVPKGWDKHITAACDKIPKLGITGVNVEPFKFPVREINGVRVRPKTNGNLGGACLCIPRRVFKSVGYYRVYGQYGLEDSDYFVRLNKLGLMSAYIEPKGVHLDTDKDKAYRKAKNRAHMKASAPLKAFAKAKIEYQKTGNVYVPYIPYNPHASEWQSFERFDGTIQATADIVDILNSLSETKGIKVGNKLDITLCKTQSAVSHDKNVTDGLDKIHVEHPRKKICMIDTGAESREITDAVANDVIRLCKQHNIKVNVISAE